MKEYALTYVNQFKTDKEGKPYMSKNGKPFVRVSVKVAEYDGYVSGLWFGADCPWKSGDKITMEIKEEIYQGKTQFKFELPKKDDIHVQRFEKIEGAVAILKVQMAEVIEFVRKGQPKKESDYPENNLEDTPF